jgi:hypothetical protein
MMKLFIRRLLFGRWSEAERNALAQNPKGKLKLEPIERPVLMDSLEVWTESGSAIAVNLMNDGSWILQSARRDGAAVVETVVAFSDEAMEHIIQLHATLKSRGHEPLAFLVKHSATPDGRKT